MGEIFFFSPNVKNFTGFWLFFERNGGFGYIFLMKRRAFWMVVWALVLP